MGIWKKTLGTKHPKLVIGLNNLAVLYCETGQYEQAEPLLKRGLSIADSAYGPDHPDTAWTLSNYAALLRATGRKREAKQVEKQAQSILDRYARTNPRQPIVDVSEWLTFRQK